MNERALYRKAFQYVRPSDEAVEETVRKMKESQWRNASRPKEKLFWNRKKAVAVAALLFLLVGTPSLAYALKSRMTIQDIQTYTDVEELQAAIEEEFPHRVHILETFENQFGFLSGVISERALYDEEGNVVEEKQPMLTVMYGVPGELKYRALWGQPNIFFSVTRLFDFQQEHAQQYAETAVSRKIQDVTVYYIEPVVKAVPENYRVTEEDLTAREQGKFDSIMRAPDIDEPEIRYLTECYWFVDGYIYELSGEDGRMDEDEWFSMAEQIILLQ